MQQEILCYKITPDDGMKLYNGTDVASVGYVRPDKLDEWSEITEEEAEAILEEQAAAEKAAAEEAEKQAEAEAQAEAEQAETEEEDGESSDGDADSSNGADEVEGAEGL